MQIPRAAHLSRPGAGDALRWGVLAAVLAGVAWAYGPALTGDFVFDDRHAVVTNQRIRDLAGFLDAWTLRSFLAGRPLTELTFALDGWRGGIDGGTFHETSLLVHLAAVVLVWIFTRSYFQRAGIEHAATVALGVTALFALHPIQAEAVAYVAQRAEALASLLSVGALAALLRAEDARSRRSRSLLCAGGVTLFGFALLAKPSVVSLPALYLASTFALPADGPDPSQAPPRSAWRRRASVALAMIVLAAVQGVALAGSLRGQDAGFAIRDLDPWRYLLTQARVVPLYLRLLLWPAGLNADHDVPLSDGLLTPWTSLAGGLLILVLLGVCSWAAIRARRVRAPWAADVRVASLGIAWFFLALAPTSSFVPVTDVAVEHRVYLASWGIFAAVVVLAARASRLLPARARRVGAAGAAVAVCLALLVTLRARAEVWARPVALWADAAAKSPGKSRPHLNLGHALHDRGDLAGALAAYQRALALEDRSLVPPLAIHNMARALAGLGRFDEARETLRRLQPPEPETYVLLALLELDAGRIVEAAEAAAFVVRNAPAYSRGHEAAAKVAAARGDLQSARLAFQRSLMLEPGDPSVLLELGRIEERLGDRAAACREWRTATRSPGNRWASQWANAEASRARCP